MMNQKKTPGAGLIKYLLILPLASALIISSNAENLIRSVKQAANQHSTPTKQVATNEAIPLTVNELDEMVVVAQATSTEKKDNPTPAPPPPPPSPTSEDEVVFMIVEKMPAYPGGDTAMFNYFLTSIRYPVEAQKNNIQGRVICQFVVNTDGSIADVNVIVGVDSLLDAEAVRVLSSMPKWIPGEQRGKKVRVKYTIPVNFSLNKKED